MRHPGMFNLCKSPQKSAIMHVPTDLQEVLWNFSIFVAFYRQIMNAIWVEAVWSALNLVQYNEKVLSFVLRCLVYIILQPVVRLF